MRFRLYLARYLYRLWRWVDPLTELERIALDAQIYGTGVGRINPEKFFKTSKVGTNFTVSLDTTPPTPYKRSK